MALKRRLDDKMRVEFFKFYFIIITSALLYLTLIVTSEPVCYTVTFWDKWNRHVKMVDCDGTDKICKKFASEEELNWVDLFESRCFDPYDSLFPPEGPGLEKDIQVFCPSLAAISNGLSPSCTNGFAAGSTCTYQCNIGFKIGADGSASRTCDLDFWTWNGTEPTCVQAITCQKDHLPTIKAGFFNCSGYTVGEKCNLTCYDGYYPSSLKETICEENVDFEGNWSVGTFQCSECKEWNEWNEEEYKFISTRQTWNESRQLCENDNAQLVTIENEEENDFVYKMLLHCRPTIAGTWIGLNDIENEGTWEWSDGTVSTYRNWVEGQPAGGDAQNCVLMDKNNGEWNDLECNKNRYAVCARNKPLNPFSTPGGKSGK